MIWEKIQKRQLLKSLLTLCLWIELTTNLAVCSVVEQMEHINVNQKKGVKDLAVHQKENRYLTAGLENIALSGTATQAGMYVSYSNAERAIDGSTDYVWHRHGLHNSIAMTGRNEGNWWLLDLGDVFDIKKIIVQGRTDAYRAHLSDAIVKVLGEDGETILGTFNIGDANAQTRWEFDMDISGATFVRLDKATHDMLAIAEVEVYGELSKRAPDDAVTHTSQGLKDSWKILLGDNLNIKNVIIINHNDCCKPSLSGTIVKVMGANGSSILGTHTITDGNSQTQLEKDMNVLGASYISVELPSTNGYLSISKVTNNMNPSMNIELNLYLYPI